MLQKNAITEVPPDIPGFYSNVSFECPGTQSIRRVASTNRFKTSEHSHLCTSLCMHTISSLPSTVERSNRSAGCLLSCTSRQQEVPPFCIRIQGILVPSASLRSEHCLSGIYSYGAQSGSLPPSSGDIGSLTPLAVILDLSKAFDTLDHNIMIEKLRHYGIENKSLNWFVSYLEKRQQFVEFENKCSEISFLSTGVPQGSILGPLLFNIYVNDIKNATQHFNIIQYADDTSLVC